jgi:hypothetical protein
MTQIFIGVLPEATHRDYFAVVRLQSRALYGLHLLPELTIS